MHLERNNVLDKKSKNTEGNVCYSLLFRKFIVLTLICSLAPLLLVGWGLSVYYTKSIKSRVINHFHTQTGYHKKIIELFLKERSDKLLLLARTHSKDYFLEPPNLNNAFELINQDNRSITDLGLIDDQGRHLAYFGPYDLMEKDYSQAPWYGKVMEKGIYISDMFLGFRKKPHFIIAVLRVENESKWILRATIDTEAFRSLVEDVTIGKTGEVYLVNRKGVYQTRPRFSGQIMARAELPAELETHKGIKVDILKNHRGREMQNVPRQVLSQTWLENPHWLLVVKQDYSEAFGDVRRTNYAMMAFLFISSLIISIVAVFITRYMIKIIMKRDAEAGRLNKQLMQAGKLASIGELSAGVAHEINNPLAIILTEKQIMLDMAVQSGIHNGELRRQLKKSMEQIDKQVNRCKHITHNLLKFARRTMSVIAAIDINEFIEEVVELMEREAKTSGIKFFSELENNLPRVKTDPSQLQQVFLNLITNAIDAHDSKPYGTIKIRSYWDKIHHGVQVAIADTGTGIPPESLGKIFDPFFTTKPVGKGTGLGLSICYSIMKQLGGEISVKSETEKGTEFFLFLPLQPPSDLIGSVHEDSKTVNTYENGKEDANAYT